MIFVIEKTTLLIYNPRAGKSIGRPKPKEILERFGADAEKIHIAVTAYPGHAKEIAALEGNRYETVICCGGDGTLNEVISGLSGLESRPVIGYIPMGSTNDLANNIGIPSAMSNAVKVIEQGESRGFDIGAFNDRCFTYIASFGPGVSVSYSTPQRIKNVLGYSAYILNGFGLQLIPTMKALKPKHICVEYDGNVLEDDFYFGTISNTLSAAGMFKFRKDEVRFNDGKFEVVLIRKVKTPFQIFSLLKKMRLHEYDGETLVHFQASKLHFTFEKPESWTMDGECSGPVSDIHIEVRNNAVRIYCPDSEYFV